MIKSKDIRERLKDIEEFLLDEYKQKKKEKEKKRDWRTYEQRLMYRIKMAIRNLEPLIDEAIETIEVHRGQGRKPLLTLKQKVILILLKGLFARSNRMMSSMVDIFSLLSGVDISYKTVERLYSDPEVEMAIHNLHVLILKKKGVENVNACGDGTGYSLTIKKHYASEIERERDKVKESDSQPEVKTKKGKKKKAFVYSFKMLDLDTNMYICYGMSLRSEKQAFNKAMDMSENLDIDIKFESVRLDRYYSSPTDVDKFGKNTKMYIIPKKNATLRGSRKWKKTMKSFVEDTPGYLEEYYKRNHSESEFSVDKRWFGWGVGQKREDRIDTALACTVVWHNLFNLYLP